MLAVAVVSVATYKARPKIKGRILRAMHRSIFIAVGLRLLQRLCVGDGWVASEMCGCCAAGCRLDTRAATRRSPRHPSDVIR